VLPNATETKIFVTGNARALRHFIELRGSEHADVEIRKVAVQMLEIMRKEAPALSRTTRSSRFPTAASRFAPSTRRCEGCGTAGEGWVLAERAHRSPAADPSRRGQERAWPTGGGRRPVRAGAAVSRRLSCAERLIRREVAHAQD